MVELSRCRAHEVRRGAARSRADARHLPDGGRATSSRRGCARSARGWPSTVIGLPQALRDATPHRGARRKWRRISALHVLLHARPTAIHALLRVALADADADVASAAATVLQRIGDRRAAEILIEGLRPRDCRRRASRRESSGSRSRSATCCARMLERRARRVALLGGDAPARLSRRGRPRRVDHAARGRRRCAGAQGGAAHARRDACRRSATRLATRRLTDPAPVRAQRGDPRARAGG